MKIKNKILIIIICFLSVFFIYGNTPEINAQEADVVAVVNSSAGTMDKTTVLQIFKGIVKEIPGAGSAKVLFNSDSAINDAFARKYLGISGSSMESIWVNIQVREGVPMPRKVPSAVVKSFVSASAVFIGFIKRSEADASVKIIE